MLRRSRVVSAGVGIALIALVGTIATPAANAHSAPARPSETRDKHVKHVLLLSVDGLHQTDLAYYVAKHPASALAAPGRRAAPSTRNAQTTFPSDSFPGMVAQLTGGGAGHVRRVLRRHVQPRAARPGTRSDCSTATPGTEVAWTEAADRSQNPITLDAGQKLTDSGADQPADRTPCAQTLADAPALTKAILKMTPNPQALLDPAALPVDPATCLPVYPHQYLKVNTVFEVARADGLRTAWSDKHPAYEILNGPSGTGVQDLFTPEINSVADDAVTTGPPTTR